MAERRKSLRVNKPKTKVDGLAPLPPCKGAKPPKIEIPSAEVLYGAVGPEMTERLLASQASAPPDIDEVAEAEIATYTSYQMRRLFELGAELARRDIEALNLYEPYGWQAEYHACMAKERAVRGGNRGGKSLATFVEDARAATSQDPYKRYPEKNGKLVIVGYDQDHIGKVIWPTLFGWGAFLIIQDEQTGDWRSYRPWNQWDRDNKHLTRPAPPLIPKRFFKGKPVWTNKGEHVFSVVRLTTGWEIWAYSSRAKPPQGFKADRYHIDEDIDNEEIVDEIHARIADKGGYFCWSALPHSANTALLNMSKRAAEQKRLGIENPDVVEFRARFDANPHIADDVKLRTIRAWQWRGSDIARMRNDGDFTMDEFLVFPEFAMGVHGVPLDSSEVTAGRLPLDWCRYAVIDPGYTTAAVLFAAVPPPSFGNFLYLEDELYINHCTSDKLAEAMKRKTDGFSYRAFIIDNHGSARTEVCGKTIRQQYSDAFERHGVKSEDTGHGFVLGSDNIDARVMAVHEIMRPRGDLPPKLRVLQGKLPNFQGEIESYMKKRVPDPNNRGAKLTIDRPDDRGHNHLMHCLQYLAHARGVRYHQPKGTAANPRGWARQYLNDKRRRERKGADAYVNLGPTN